MSFLEKFPNLPGFEPGIFWSVVRRVIHCATGPAIRCQPIFDPNRTPEAYIYMCDLPDVPRFTVKTYCISKGVSTNQYIWTLIESNSTYIWPGMDHLYIKGIFPPKIVSLYQWWHRLKFSVFNITSLQYDVYMTAGMTLKWNDCWKWNRSSNTTYFNFDYVSMGD